jgi:hypothetical protein
MHDETDLTERDLFANGFPRHLLDELLVSRLSGFHQPTPYTPEARDSGC